MNENGEKELFERLVDRVLDYGPKKAKRKKKKKQKPSTATSKGRGQIRYK